MKATTKTGREIERAAAARFDYAALGIDGARVFYNPNRRAWMIELDTDPAQYFVAERGEDGAFHFEDVT
jgi:hypothetical protein